MDLVPNISYLVNISPVDDCKAVIKFNSYFIGFKKKALSLYAFCHTS